MAGAGMRAGLPQQDTEAVAGPASALAPSASAASLKLRGLTPGTTAGLHSHSNSSSSYVSGQVGGPGRIAPAHSALLRTSSSDATASGSLTVRPPPDLHFVSRKPAPRLTSTKSHWTQVLRRVQVVRRDELLSGLHWQVTISAGHKL